MRSVDVNHLGLTRREREAKQTKKQEHVESSFHSESTLYEARRVPAPGIEIR
jgi:hypothetical protein